MQAEEFLKKVRVRARLDNQDEARRATGAVFDTLRARISHRGGDNVAEQLPVELRKLWEAGTLDHILRSIAGVDRMDLGAFLARVAKELQLTDIRQAENVSRAVFATLQDQVTEGAVHAIEHQLPEDILGFWRDSRESDVPVPEVSSAQPEPLQEPPVIVPEFGFQRTEEEESGAWPRGPQSDVPTGADMEFLEAQNEARARDLRAQAAMGPVPEVEPPSPGPANDEVYRSDPDLTHEVWDALDESDEIDSRDIDVSVSAGEVTLRGKVPSERDRQAAWRIASSQHAAGTVHNELRVEDEDD